MVFDSSTLILLAKVSLLRDIVQEINGLITDIVEDESTKKDVHDAKVIRELIKEGLIGVVGVKPNELSKIKVDFNIQPGEASSLALAIKEKCFLATDDGPTIKACIILNVDFMTAVHFVVKLHKKRVLDKKMALEKLSGLEKHGRYKPQIIHDAKQRIEGD